jgi:hypothetical protein
MHKYEVDGYFFDEPKPVQEGLTLSFDSSGATLLVSLSDMTDKEAEKIRKGKIEFAVFEKGQIMYFLVRIAGVFDGGDAPFHYGLYADTEKRPIPEIEEGTGLGLTVVGVDARNGRIKALRLIGLGTDISRKMVSIMQEQKEQPIDREDYNRKIERTYRSYTYKEMLKMAVAKFKVPERT